MSRSAHTLLAALVTALIVVAGGTPAAEALNGHPYDVLMPSSGSAPNLTAVTPHLIRLPDTSTTKSRSVDSTYDVRCDLRVVTQAAHAVESTVGTVTYQRERSLDRPTEAQGASTTPSVAFVATEAASGVPTPTQGQTVYRVYGGDSAAGGASWSPTNPGSVGNYRNAAGLPSGGASGATNTGQFVIEGTIADPSKVVLTRNALPLDGMTGGLPEYIIPQWMDNGAINVTRVSGANPHF